MNGHIVRCEAIRQLAETVRHSPVSVLVAKTVSGEARERPVVGLRRISKRFGAPLPSTMSISTSTLVKSRG